MATWYSKVKKDPTYNELANAIEYYQNQYDTSRDDLSMKGKRIEEMSKLIPGLVEFRWAQLQDLEAIITWLERVEEKERITKKRAFLENYSRTLSDRVAGEYAAIDADVLLLRELQEEVCLVRNQYLGLHKALEWLHFQIGHIVRLRVAGIEDATL